MRYSEQPLQTFRLRNFKAVRDSGVVKFTPLTVFIGNNGSGKSSLIEGLETFQSIITDGLDEAMNRWRGYENVLNKAIKRRTRTDEYGRLGETHPIEFQCQGKTKGENFKAKISVNSQNGGIEIYIQEEQFKSASWYEHRASNGSVDATTFFRPTRPDYVSDGKSCLESHIDVEGWQFLTLDPSRMGEPQPQKRTGRTIQLNHDGSNIGDYLLDIMRYDEGRKTFEGIVQTLKYVLPYAKDVKPAITSELQRTVYLQLSEAEFQVPGWLLSTGTLRALALLVVLRHPNPPSLLCIEEIENGLDPRTLNLLVDEIQRATQSGKTQVICTTHSPYFLDLVPLSSIVVVERDESAQPTFIRPNAEALGDWATKFAPGQLYTMSQLTHS